MPAPTSATITLTGSAPAVQEIAKGGKITFTNGTSTTITLNPPSCVSPSNTITLAPGASSNPLTVNNSASGNYNYNYSVGAANDPVNGTIDVM
jgi:hypothetical protein